VLLKTDREKVEVKETHQIAAAKRCRQARKAIRPKRPNSWAGTKV